MCNIWIKKKVFKKWNPIFLGERSRLSMKKGKRFTCQTLIVVTRYCLLFTSDVLFITSN